MNALSEKWYKIDNAGKIFPTIWNKNSPNSFRLSAVLKSEVEVSLLEPALKQALERFPTFCVKLRRGLFWYYFEKNNQKPIIREEPPIIFSEIHPYKNNGYLFSLNYYGKRLSIDIFHALTDGTGGLEFFKCILYNYLEQLGGKFENKGQIITNDFEKVLDETQDSFLHNYDKQAEKILKEPKGHKLSGTYYSEGRLGVIHTIMNVQELKAVAKKYDSTITEYLGACFLEALYKTEYNKKTKEKVFNLFVAVNVRKYFDSRTLRNFALFIRTHSKFNDQTTFEEIIEAVKIVFKQELTKEKMQARIMQNVRLEKNFFVRILPLFIKKQAMKIGYKILGSSIDTVNFSNLGICNLPKGCEEYVDRIEFVITASRTTPINASSITYNDKFVLTFTTAILECNLEKTVIDRFVAEGLNVTIETNDLEVE